MRTKRHSRQTNHNHLQLPSGEGIVIFFPRTFFTAVRSPQILRIPLGSEWEPAWLRRANQPEHFAQRRAICLPCLAGAAPHIAEQGGSDCVLLRTTQQCPPPALPAGPASLAERRGPRGANPQQVTDEVTTFCGPAPSNFTGQDDETLGPGAKEFWISVPFFLLAVTSAAPSSRAVRGCGWPFALSVETKVTSQQRAEPCRVALYTTRSNLRRSSSRTPGAVVRASHCCGTTRPSPPRPSRQTRTQACSSRGACLARRPERAHAALWYTQTWNSVHFPKHNINCMGRYAFRKSMQSVQKIVKQHGDAIPNMQLSMCSNHDF